MINADTLSKMKKGIVLINCARGALTDIKALISGIESEHIGALGLDCMEYEEDIVHRDLRTDILSNRDMAYLRQFKNVVHTQHMAFYTDSAVKSMVYCGVCGLLEMKEGKPAPHSFADPAYFLYAKSGSPSLAGTFTSPCIRGRAYSINSFPTSEPFSVIHSSGTPFS